MIEELLMRYCEGDVSDVERCEVEAWLSESKENRKILNRINALYLALDVHDIEGKIDVDSAFNKVKDKIKRRKRILFVQRVQKVAAILFLPLLIWFLVEQRGEEEQFVAQHMLEVRSNSEMTTSLVLPDSTVVYLNTGSSLKCPAEFQSGVRNVILNGEAYFDVKKSDKQKFVVSIPNGAEIEVMGTKFNVDAYGTDDKMSVTLVDGAVKFRYDKTGNDKEEVAMSKGQKLVYELQKNMVFLSESKGEVETAWKDDKIIFSNTSMEDVLKILGKRFDVSFQIRDNALKDNSFTGTFIHQSLDRILEYFRISSNIQWRYVDTGNENAKKSSIEIFLNQ